MKRSSRQDNKQEETVGSKDVIIRVEDIRKVYVLGNEKVVALDRINLEIYRGEILCIFGTSGSGKSTLLNMLAGLEKPTQGKVWIGKTNISALSENQLAIFRQRHIGFVFQFYNLLNIMTAVENVALPLCYIFFFDYRKTYLLKTYFHRLDIVFNT